MYLPYDPQSESEAEHQRILGEDYEAECGFPTRPAPEEHDPADDEIKSWIRGTEYQDAYHPPGAPYGRY